MAIDEKLKKEFDDLVKSWSEMDKLFDHEIGEVMKKVVNIEKDTKQIQEKLSGFEEKQTRAIDDVKSKIKQIKENVTGLEEKQAKAIGEIKSKTEQIQEKLSEFEENQTRALGEVKSKSEQIQGNLTGFEENQTKALNEVKSTTQQIQDKLTGFEVNQARELGEVMSKTEQIQENLTRFEENLTELGGNQSRLEKSLTAEIREIKMQYEQIRQHQSVDKLPDFQKELIDIYQQHCKTLPMLPLSRSKVDDLLLVYESPTMHIVEDTKDTKQITCYEDVFLNAHQSCKEIYMTGGAGVGKTSFCRHLCLMWCYAKCCHKIEKEYEYVSKFDYVFYINLRDTEYYHVIDIIKESYFEHIDHNLIKNILRKSYCLIIFDGLDEWNLKKVGTKTHELPKRVYSKDCIYLTTCRPYREENMRLSKQDCDHQISISGIHGRSLMSYIENILNLMNKQNSSNKKSSNFNHDIQKCGLTNEIGIPIISSHLVVLWYEKTLEGMTRTLIYANILEMLFQRADQREIRFPPSTVSTLQLPDSLSDLTYTKEHVSLLYKVCHLSFCSMFKQDENATKLVFSRHQLQSEPYCFLNAETDFLCKIGILSTNEVFGCYSVEKLKISFIHRSYLDFFAALFVSSFDSCNSFRDATKTWKCLNDVVQFENFFLFLAGLSSASVKILFENIYLALSADLTSCRKNALFQHSKYFYQNQLVTLQNSVVSCFNEISRSNDKTVQLRMEDFLFDKGSKIVDILRKLLLLNTTNVKSLHYKHGCKYFDEFDQIKNLQCINIAKVSSVDYVKFTQCMVQNKSTLHTVCIEGGNKLIPELPARNLHHMTSLSLSRVKMQHNSLHYLVEFLSDNVLIENIKLYRVFCDNHQVGDSDCILTLNLLQHTKLTSLYLRSLDILCNNVSNSSLQSITLYPLSERIVRLCYNCDIFNCVNDSQLEHLYIEGYLGYMLDYNAMKTLTSTVKTLRCIKSLTLYNMKLHDDILLQLHPHVTQVKIDLNFVTMSRQCFHLFVQSCVNNKSEIKVQLYYCDITSVDGESHCELSQKESVEYMSEHLKSMPAIDITHKGDEWLRFETRSCQKCLVVFL